MGDMKDIKFRAWNTVAKQWQTHYSGMTCDGNKLVLMPDADYTVSDEVALVFQQYTGLKDKNGKEIYEGDVVACNYCDKDYGEVYWNKSGVDFRIKWKDDCCANARLTRINHWCAVVGNIYENPELLTK